MRGIFDVFYQLIFCLIAMNKNTLPIIVFFTIFAGFIGLAWWGGLAQNYAVSSTGARSVLTASEIFYDFGTISMKNGNVSTDFTVTNSTDKDIVVSSLITSCMCTTAFIVEPNGATKGAFGMPGMGYLTTANETIGAGESRIIRVVYDPNAHGPAGVGLIDRTITLTDSSGASLQLEIKAMVTP